MRRSQIPHKSSINSVNIEVARKKGGHATRRALIEVTSELMDRKPLLQITSDQVLTASGISKGSMYHFFNDFDELLEVTQAERFNNWAHALTQCVSRTFASATDRESFINALEEILHDSCENTAKISNTELTRTLGFALGNSRFSQNIIEIKEYIRHSLLVTLSESMERAFPDEKVATAENLALFIETWIFGKITGEFYRNPVQESEWKSLSRTLITSLLAKAA